MVILSPRLNPCEGEKAKSTSPFGEVPAPSEWAIIYADWYYATLRDLILDAAETGVLCALLCFLIIFIEGNRRFERFGITRRACTRLRLRTTHDGVVHGYARVGCGRHGLPGLLATIGGTCCGWIWSNPSCAANSHGHDV